MSENVVRFLDLSVRGEERSEIERIFRKHVYEGKFVLGDSVAQFEDLLAKDHQRQFSVGVKTGTDALTLGIRVLSLPPGSTVITTPFSWLASATAVCMNGLKLQFVDVGDDLNIDADKVEMEVGPDVSAILAVHMHGNMCDMVVLKQLADKYNLKLIEDCAQGYHAVDEVGYKAGSYGDIAAFSFNPMKTLGALGDGGAVVFDNESYRPQLQKLRHSDVSDDGDFAKELSHNCRLDSIQASFLNIRMRYIESKIRRRMELFELYEESLPNFVKLVRPRSGCLSNYYVMQGLFPERDSLKQYLEEMRVETKIRHPFLLQDHPVIRECSKGDTPVARSMLDKILCLPMHDHLTDDEVYYVSELINDFYR